jgi:hypothetical protein
MRLSDIGSKLSEGYRVVPGFDREKYQERQGLEGPFHTKSGKVVYYDKAEGKYYDPDTDMYIEYDDWRAMNEQGVAGPKNCWPGHRKVGTKPGTGKNAGKRVNDCEEIKEGLNEFAPGAGGGESGRWYTDDQMTDIVGDGWWQDLDVSGDIPKQAMIQEAQAWLDDQGYNVQVLNCKLNDDDMEWYIEGSFQNSNFAKKGVAEGSSTNAEVTKRAKAAAQKAGKTFDTDVEYRLWYAITTQANAATRKADKKQGMAEGGFKNMYAEFSGYGNYMQGRAVNVFKTAGLEIVSKDYTEDDDIQTYVVKGDRQSIEKAGEYLERNVEQFGGYHFVKSGVSENYPKHQDLSGVSTDKLKAYLDKQAKQSAPGEGSQVKRVQAELQRRSQGVAEGYQFKGPFPFDVDHMHGGRGINLPKAETKKYFTDKKQWQRAVDDINSSKYDDNSDYIGVTGRSTVEINGREWARWSDAQQKGYIELSSMSEQGVAEGSEQRWRVTVGNKSGTLSHTKTFTGTKEQAIKQAVTRFATSRNPVVTAELVKQDVKEGSKEKTPGIALSKAYKKDFDGNKPGHNKPETALTGTYSKTGKPGGELKKKGVAEAGNKPLEKSRFGTGDTRTPRDIKSQMSQASDEFVRSTADKTTGPFHSKVAKMQGKMAKSELRRREQGVGEGMMDNPGEQDSPVAQAIIRRILLQRTDLLAKYGPEKVGQAVDDVADFVGDEEEIGSSDVSAWVNMVQEILVSMDHDMSESTDTLNVGDDVVITGAVKYKGATGVVDSVGRDGNFIVVNLYNHGKQSFQSADVSYNDYAGSEAEETEMQLRGLGESAPRSALGKAIKEVSKFKR